MSTRRVIVLVGALRPRLRDNRLGGQTFACGSLYEGLRQHGWDVVGIDTSRASIQAKGGLRRLPSAIVRIFALISTCVRMRPAAVLLFASHGLSFVEKGVMVALVRGFRIRAILFPRSGHLSDQAIRSFMFREFVRISCNLSYKVICQSEGWRRFFSSLDVKNDKLVVIENWLRESAYSERKDCVAASGVDDFIAGFYGRVEHQKGVFDFLEAVCRARKRLPSLKAIIYGDGSAVPEVLAWIAENGMHNTVAYGGWLSAESKTEALRALDVFVFTSHAEGFPNSLLEVIALKIPVISVKVGAVQDILSDGASAILTKIGDIEGLANAIECMAGDRAMAVRMASAAYDRACSENRYLTAISKVEELVK